MALPRGVVEAPTATWGSRATGAACALLCAPGPLRCNFSVNYLEGERVCVTEDGPMLGDPSYSVTSAGAIGWGWANSAVWLWLAYLPT